MWYRKLILKFCRKVTSFVFAFKSNWRIGSTSISIAKETMQHRNVLKSD